MAKTAVEFDNVSIVFGDQPDRALPLMDQGQTRGDIQASTGQVLGVHNCSLTVAEGEILVLMGLSGSGKSTLLRAVNGLNPVVRGCVRVSDGNGLVDVTHAKPAELRHIRQTKLHNLDSTLLVSFAYDNSVLQIRCWQQISPQ